MYSVLHLKVVQETFLGGKRKGKEMEERRKKREKGGGGGRYWWKEGIKTRNVFLIHYLKIIFFLD